jgi:hypothetical protein
VASSQSRLPHGRTIRLAQSVVDFADVAMPKREHGRFLPGGHVFRSPGHMIDGGENYQYRGSDFADSKTYRKETQPNLSPNYVIPLSLRNSWMIKDNISFGTLRPAILQRAGYEPDRLHAVHRNWSNSGP